MVKFNELDVQDTGVSEDITHDVLSFIGVHADPVNACIPRLGKLREVLNDNGTKNTQITEHPNHM